MPKAVTYEALHSQLVKPDVMQLAPVNILYGAEGYYIDQLVEAFENVLPADEREFNQYILYATQTTPDQWLDACRRFPMMSDRQVVILKEAQNARPDQIDRLARYIAEPVQSTILVICFRAEKIKGTKFNAALKKATQAVVFESKKVPDWQLEQVIKNYIQARGLNVQPKALEMLKEYIGSDLSHMYNEVDKLITILGSGATVTPEAIERHIGFSKDFNSFEFVDALAVKDAAKAMRIVNYFRANPKAVPTVMLTATVFAFFSDLLVTYFVKDKSERSMMQALGLRYPGALKRYQAAQKHYNAFQVIEIIRAIRAFDAATKGLRSRRNEHDLLHELTFRILTAPGTLFPEF